MELSIIIPCFNAAATLGIQLEALAGQKWKAPWEVLLCDNGSTDETLVIAEEFRARLPHLRIIDASDVKGPAHARNFGARAASGTALAFCDADDKVAPGWVSAMGTALLRHEFVASRFVPMKLTNSRVSHVRQCPQQEGLQTYDYPPFLLHAASAGLGVQRKIHEAVGGFDESMYMLEDTDYCWRIQLMGVKLHFASDAVVHYRFRSSLREMYRQSRLWGEYNVLLYKKYRSYGMTALSRKEGIKKGIRLLKRFPKVMRHKESCNRWLWDFSWYLGRLKGSIKYRIFGL